MIRRAEHSADKKFFLFTRKTAQDKQLSFQAKGLLAYVLSKPSDWSAKDADLMKMGGIKRHALNTILDELKERGYARRVRERQKGGKFVFFLEIAEEPIFSGQSPLPDFPVTDEPLAENQVVAIDSTCVRAGSSVELTDLRDSKPPKKSHKPKEPEIIIDPPYYSPAFIEALGQYKQVKREMGYPLTRTMTEELYAKLAKHSESDCVDALHEAAAHGYKGVYFDRGNGNGNGHKGNEQPYTGPVKSKPDLIAQNCPDCKGMLNVRFEVDGIWYAKPCKHENSPGVAA